MKEKDKEVEIRLDEKGGSIKLKNQNNRVLATIGDIVIDKLSFYRWNNALKFRDKYQEKKTQRNLQGRETPIPPKFIIEVLENAFNEDNENIQNEWNNLLLNWQDPDKNCDKKYMYIDLLKNLDINEIKLLKMISKDTNFEMMLSNSNMYYDRLMIQKVMNLSDEEYELMIVNLYRLKICDTLKSEGNIIAVGNLSVHADGGIDKFRVTRLGYNLIKSCEE